jgi:hypothetical protein
MKRWIVAVILIFAGLGCDYVQQHRKQEPTAPGASNLL